MNQKDYDDIENISKDEINKKADELARKLYNENKAFIDEVIDDNIEVLKENEEASVSYNTKSKKSKAKKAFWVFFGMCALLLILILITSNVLSVGNNILASNKYLGIAFYSIIALLVLILIIIPTFQVMFLPSYSSMFSIEKKGESEKVKANVKKIKYIVARHEKEWNINNLSEKQRLKYSEAVKTLKESKDDKELTKSYRYLYKTFIKKDVLQIVTNYANKVFLATSIVQNGKIDSLLMLTTYVKMSRDVLKYCGYRIEFIRLCKLFIEILKMLVAATKLSQIDFSAIFPKMMMNSMSKIPGAKIVVNSLSDGVSNALIFYKTGVMLEEYLLSDNQNLIHQWGVSIKETAQYMLVGLVGEILKKIAEFTTLALKKTIEGIQKFFQTIQTQITMKKQNKKLIQMQV